MAIIAVILLILIAVFTLENRSPVSIQFLGWRYDTVLSYAVIASLLIGAFVIYVAGLFRQRELRAQVRDAELRLREVERARAAAGTTSPGAGGTPTQPR